jgi:hydantoinase/carbamoylase family amidase
MLDGCYGVMSALEVIRTLNDNSVATRHPLEIISFSNEEGVRYPMMIGSKVASGLMELGEAYELKDGSGIPYRQALESGGMTKSSLAPARRLVGEIKAWVELHIEQGPVLESEGVKIGIVEGIVGLIHKLVAIRGRAGHAGATPMNVRHDPLLGCAMIIQQVNRIAKEISTSSVGTVGLVRVEPGAMNVIPGKVEMGIDFRDLVAERMDRGMARIEAEIERICKELGLDFGLTERSRLVPKPMSKKIMNSIERAAKAWGATHRLMPSGAGHDTQNMARICETGMIFVPSRGGISHAPDEWTDPSDLALGADVLLGTIIDLDRD